MTLDNNAVAACLTLRCSRGWGADLRRRVRKSWSWHCPGWPLPL